VNEDARTLLKAYIEHARWFGGKGRPFQVTGVRRLHLHAGVPGDPEDRAPTVAIELALLAYEDGGSDTYQLPVSYHPEERPGLEHARIGAWQDPELGEVHAYDALHDHAATPLWLHSLATGATLGPVRFVRVGDHELDTEARSTVFSGQQSNTSVAFGDDSLMKVFRRLTPGTNPDIEILSALSEAGSDHVATLYGYVETDDPLSGEVVQLGILQQFLRTASDGWDIALASLRDLLAEAMHAQDAGGDFASESHRLGVALAEMHQTLAEAFPTQTWDRSHLSGLADEMSARLDAAVEVVPGIEPYAAALHASFDAVRHHPGPVTAQRVHGDLHLGQTLRTVRTWKIIDFEGEPAKPLAERRRPDSPWRDVAGMVRSFDYAAELSRLDHEQSTGDADQDDAEQAREWSQRNTDAFLAGYREAVGVELDQVLLTAYTADKAVYEAVYEARNRPSWLPIPLAALHRIAVP
jgi:maltokinase